MLSEVVGGGVVTGIGEAAVYAVPPVSLGTAVKIEPGYEWKGTGVVTGSGLATVYGVLNDQGAPF
jgi:hypothetical protein